jgi:glycosyltransferase involved in cell wall biosynthesis
MKILLIHNHYRQPGGEDVVFAEEAALLCRQGHEVIKYTESNQRTGEMSRAAVAAQAIWSRASRQKLLRKLHDARPDVVHIHNTFSLISPSAYYACRDARVPVVQTLHNYRLFCPTATFYRDGLVCEDCLGKTPPWLGVWRACYHDSRAQTAVIATMLTLHRLLKTWREQVDVYVALTEFGRGKFIEAGLPEDKIMVKPNFVSPDPGERESKGDYALFVGRLSREKGVRNLLKAWQNLRAIPLKIIGAGPLDGEARTFIRTQKLDRVSILGQLAHEEIFSLMKSARFLIFPSEWYETFGCVTIEAFACGVPVIASRLGSMTEIVEDGRTGLHFAPGDPNDLAEKIEWAWTHPERIAAMGREARAEFEAKYTAKRNYEMLRNIYQTAVERFKARQG